MSSGAAELQGEQVRLVPVAPGHVPRLRQILETPAVRARWGDEARSPGWPFDDISATRFSVLCDHHVEGMIQYAEETSPDYRHASIDIFLDPAIHGRGLGRDAVATLALHLMGSLGHHRIVIDPAADNQAAIRCYSAVGFRPVGIMREYERDPDGAGWHDGLLMELLTADLKPGRRADRIE